ncbi:hypothetical protein [Sphingomonas hankookensis]|uniref:Uncharacterized protein n=2 Tax=Sphingomonas TaxID=13687 RepID=A0A2W4ZA71_9SPHN|nr:MAG: hypothetical protein DI632_05165 [Sphingomonas hengshuiensis]
MGMTLHFIAYTGCALFLLTHTGNILCRAIFDLTGLRDAVATAPPVEHTAGRWIGTLERLILAIGILSGSWEVFAFVIALKTVARIKEMDQRVFAEYFLVGSLFSLLWTIAVVGAWQAYDHQLGADTRKLAVNWLGVASAPD